MISIDGLTKHYGKVVGLDDLTLEVRAGEALGFLGPNGAGKTTTIRLLLDLIRPTRGRARIGGFDCHRQSLQARRLVGYLPGEMPIYPELTGEAYLDYLARLDDRRADPAVLDRLLGRFDLGRADLKRRMRDLSHGTKRKLGLVQALMSGPALVILDEPTSGLDPLMIEAFAEVVEGLRREGRSTVFLSSHVLSEVERTCDRVALIQRGRLAAVKTVSEIQQGFPRRVTIDFLEPVNAAVPLPPGASVVSRSPRRWVLEVNGPLARLLANLDGLPVADIDVERFSLEDYVLRLLSGGGVPGQPASTTAPPSAIDR
jgi:ABC-2 type transport system ATP-binding protein